MRSLKLITLTEWDQAGRDEYTCNLVYFQVNMKRIRKQLRVKTGKRSGKVEQIQTGKLNRGKTPLLKYTEGNRKFKPTATPRA